MGDKALPEFQDLPRRPHCQCEKGCNLTPLEGKAWCKKHGPKRTKKTRSLRSCKMSPVTGKEPIRNLEAWNKNSPLKESHNCFSYAMNAIDKKLMKDCASTDNCNVGFHQPGYASGYGQFTDDHGKGCSEMVSRLWGDNPDVIATSFTKRCPHATSKIALIVDPKRDYHFLRQDSDGYWSHKPGAMDVTTKDASGRPILRPDRALFIYKHRRDPLQYTKFCGYYCVPRGKPLYLMSDPRQEGGFKLPDDVSSYPVSTRYQMTRKKSRGASLQSED